MSYESWNDGGLTQLERDAGLWGLLYGRNNDEYLANQRKVLVNSARFKEGAKLVAGLSGNGEIKLALIQKVRHDSLNYAIVRYMAKEALPDYYAAILKTPKCIDRLVEGVFSKVCKIKITQTLAEQISNLSSSLRSNPSRLAAYDRVTLLQQFIYRTVDGYFGVGAALSIPVTPMKNALSAARLHLSILDLIDREPDYVDHIDRLSTAASQLEYNKPRPSTAPFRKRSWPRWRVRHLRPLSYYFRAERRALIQGLRKLDENIPSDQFVVESLLLYADVD